MASLLSHPAIPLTLFWSKVRGSSSRRLLWLSIILTMLPDADVIAFKFGIPYESQWGHRGFTHSVTFALIIGAIGSLFAARLQVSRWVAFWWCFISILSHVVLDALTNGGLGVAAFWPISSERYFFPLRPIQVSPIGVAGFLSWRGLVVVISELFWIWLPCFILSALVRYRARKKKAP